jgi:hypothetical protein
MEIKRFDMPMMEYHVGDKIYRQAVLTDEKLEKVLDLLTPALNLDIEKLGKAEDLSEIGEQVIAFFREIKGITELKGLLLMDEDGNPVTDPIPIEVLVEAVSDFLALNENWIKRLKSFLNPFSKAAAPVLSRTGPKRKSGSSRGSRKTRSTTKD